MTVFKKLLGLGVALRGFQCLGQWYGTGKDESCSSSVTNPEGQSPQIVKIVASRSLSPYSE